MRRLALALALTASASPVEAQRASPERSACLTAETAYRAPPHEATRALRSVYAVSTDGFGTRYSGPTGRALRARGATTILADGALAWHTPADRQLVLRCDSEIRLAPDPGLRQPGAVRLAVEVGNETGDPGPLRYLDPSLPNVDKIGPDYEGTLRLGRTTASLRWRDFLPTDPAIAPRVFDALDDRFPKRKGLAGSVRSHVWNVPFVVDGLAAEDLPFEETLGREVPTRRRALGAEAEGEIGRTHLRAKARAAWLDRPSWSRLAISGPDWREAMADVRAHHRLHPSDATLFARIRPVWASGPGLADGSLLWGEAGAAKGAVAARISASPSGLGGTLRAQIPPQVMGAMELSAAARAERQLPEAAPDLLFWAARGYNGLASSATPLARDGLPRPRESASVHAGAARTWNNTPRTARVWRVSTVSLSVDAEARRGEPVLLPEFRLAEGAVAVEGPVRATGASGLAADAELRAEWSWFEPVQGTRPAVSTTLAAWARARAVLAGDDAFRAARDRQPALRFGALAEHSPDGNLALHARLEWRSATRWEGWPDPALPAALLADLGLGYSLGPLTLALTGRNVLGAREQTHPLGATLDGRLFVRLEARF